MKTAQQTLSASQLYLALEAAGVPMDHHESDLYVPVNDTTRRLVVQYQFRSMVTAFHDSTDESLWYEIPFAWLPFWRQREVAP